MNTFHSFASDNHAPVHPKIMDKLVQINQGDALSYGEDEITHSSITKFREIFGEDTDVYFVFNGTGANTTGLAAVLRPYQSVICAQSAHIQMDECGASERFAGSRLVLLPTRDGKIRINQIKPLLFAFGNEHHAQPRVISITQSTELGTVYSAEEVRELASFAHENRMLLHMDGARIANAAAALGKGLREITRDAGVDILSFGGTKNGLMLGEAVLFFDSGLSEEYKYVRKQGMQLASKMRYLSAQFLALLENDLWLTNARHANAMTKLLEERIREFPSLIITQKVEANAIFAKLPPDAIPKLQKEFFFYIWDEETSEVRWMTSFATTPEDVEAFAQAIGRVLSSK